MIIFIEIVSSIVIFILSFLFWQVVKAKKLIITILKKPELLNRFIDKLNKVHFFNKKPEEINETGKLWTESLPQLGYEQTLGIESQSSIHSFNKTRNMFFLLLLIIFLLISFYSTISYLIINLIIFFLSYLIPESTAANNRVFNEISALSWLIFHFHKDKPEDCKKFIDQAWVFKNLYNATIANAINSDIH